jgi:hypothetical protein
MASRKPPRKRPSKASGLVPALRDAVAVVDRALKELGRTPAAGKKRAGRTKSRKA